MMGFKRFPKFPGWLKAKTLFALLAAFATSAAAASDAHPMRFDRLTLDNGLSQSSVVSILQDSDGFMWFGTESGLNRYDGYEFTHFKRERGNPEALRSDFIYDMGEALNGDLWIATNGGGVARFDRETETFTTYRHDPANRATIASDIVRRLLVDTDGSVWIGSRNGGLDRLNPADGTVTHFKLTAAGGESVFALHKDVNNRLWIGADEGLFLLDIDSGAIQAFEHDAGDATSISSNRVRSILVDNQGQVWIGTRDAGLNRYDAATGGFEHFRHDPAQDDSLSHDRVTAIYEDDGRRLWVATSRGLNLFTDGRFVRYQNSASDAYSLSSDAISSIFQDRSGLMWIGTLTAGVNKWNPRSWALGFKDSGSIASTEDARPNVTAFATDSRTLYIGTFGDGLIARDRADGSTKHFRHDPANPASLSDNRVMSLIAASDGAIWAGTMRGGLNRLDPQTGDVRTFRHEAGNDASLSADGIMALFEDSKGAIWAGTFGGGVSVFDPSTKSFTRIGKADGLTSPRITSFAEDRRGNVWIGTDAGGLNLLLRDSGSIVNYRYDENDPQSLSSDTVYSLHVDADNDVWVGTRGGGLDRVIGSSDAPLKVRFDNTSQRDGLSNDDVYGVQSDARGELWLSTNYGITRFDVDSNKFRTLHRRDGLQSDEFNFGAHHQSADGTLFFGGVAGYNEFEPEGLPVSSVIPPVMLTGFFNSGDEGEADIPSFVEDGVELGYKDDSVSFEFAALDYASPLDNRYMYKLEGFDEEWIDLGNRRRVTYTDLDDGYYLLRVKAANADGVWNESGLALPVSVAAAPWDTWWAYLGYVAMFAQICLFFWWSHQRKIRREEEYSQRLEREVEMRTRELAERSEELVKLNSSLQESSLSDPLTGLRNRRFVFEEISRDLETIGRKHSDERRGLSSTDCADLVFMMIDLDNFKPINDTYGHAAGDQMLLEIRDVLLSTCRRSDFVVRWGGDEFVVVAKQSHPGEAEALAERIRSKIAATSFTLSDGQIVRTSCSIGFVAYPLFNGHADNAGLDEVINIADSLMYESKRQRNAWVGLLGVDQAVTSEGFAIDDIEPSSVLFRARRNGRLIEHNTGQFEALDAGGAA